MTDHVLDLLGEPANGPVQQELEKITGQLTVPQVFVSGKFVGGADFFDELREKGSEAIPEFFKEQGAELDE
jgi:glutaredoxin-related protein